jgi:hypothetical protein
MAKLIRRNSVTALPPGFCQHHGKKWQKPKQLCGCNIEALGPCPPGWAWVLAPAPLLPRGWSLRRSACPLQAPRLDPWRDEVAEARADKGRRPERRTPFFRTHEDADLSQRTWGGRCGSMKRTFVPTTRSMTDDDTRTRPGAGNENDPAVARPSSPL